MKDLILLPGFLFFLFILPTGCRQILGDREQPESIVQVPYETSEIIVTSPTRGSIYNPEDVIRIKWFANSIQTVDIELYRKSEFKFAIARELENSGIFDWEIPSDISLSNHYILKIINHNNPDTYEFSGRFGIQ